MLLVQFKPTQRSSSEKSCHKEMMITPLRRNSDTAVSCSSESEEH